MSTKNKEKTLSNVISYIIYRFLLHDVHKNMSEELTKWM